MFSLTTARPGMPPWFRSPAASELGYRSGLITVMALAKDTEVEASGATAFVAKKSSRAPNQRQADHYDNVLHTILIC